MKHSIKSCIAYIAACAAMGKPNLRLHDNGKDSPVRVDGNVIDGHADITHSKKGYHIEGPLSELKDPENDIHISIQLDGLRFSGKDHRKGVKFKGKIKDDHVSLSADGYASYQIL